MKELMAYLPESYDGSPETRTIQEAVQPELEALWEGRDSLLAQLDPNTATWGLDYWEQALGLATDQSKEMEYRRSRIVSKLRGSGTTTAALIKNVSESFTNGEVDVEEAYGEYTVRIRFVGRIGIPPNLEDLRDALKDIMPAHLAWEFVITYRLNQEIQAYTHGGLAVFQHQTIREGDLTND